MNGENEAFNYESEASVFVAIKALQGLRKLDPRSQVLMSDIAAFLKGSEHKSPEVKNAVAADVRFRRLYTLLLQQQRIGTVPAEAVAQDAPVLDRRAGDGFVVLFRQSRADAAQTYVILELNSDVTALEDGRFLLHGQLADDVVRLHFSVSRSRGQTILSTSDIRLSVLRNPSVELSLIQQI
ncbi:MAG: hypothetical protein SV765_08985 [Pseudomonadota bacterium]|nr:hypothetical protein [Pseudomonadota bacterium]